MAATLQETPSGSRIHIGFYGKRNSGKSSLFNAFAGQHISIISEQAGTTTDPVSKAMEIHGLGACVLIDTAGFDDIGILGGARVEKTKKTVDKTDIAILLCNDRDLDEEEKWYRCLKEKQTPVILVVNKADILENQDALLHEIKQRFGDEPVIVSAKTGSGLEALKERMLRVLPEDYGAESITGNLVKEGDTVLLVMPQDIQAPQGRLILPQVQTIRELLDKKCIVISTSVSNLRGALDSMKQAPG